MTGKADALILAQALEDNGCGFLANLSAQNISLGGCFSWDTKFAWNFKTLEVFCPQTCDCLRTNSDGTGCPRPFGKYCNGGQVDGCLTWNDQHYCPGFNADTFQADLQFFVVDFALLNTGLVSVFFSLFYVLICLGHCLSFFFRSTYFLEIVQAVQSILAERASVQQTVPPETVTLEPWCRKTKEIRTETIIEPCFVRIAK